METGNMYCYQYPHPAVTTDCVIFGFDGTKLRVLLIERGIDPFKGMWALPGGFLRMDEDAEKGALRELKEETGATAKNYFPLGTLYPSPGYTNEIIYMYAATELSFGEAQPDDDEFINLVRMPLEKAVGMVLSGEIPDSKTQAALLKAEILLKQGKIPLTSDKKVI